MTSMMVGMAELEAVDTLYNIIIQTVYIGPYGQSLSSSSVGFNGV